MRIGRGSIRSAPLTTRDMSTRSSSSCRWRSALRRMTLSASRTSVGRSRRGSSTCVQPRMAFSGLRSSCEIVVRNSSRRCAASSAAARSRVSSSTVSCSSRMRMASSGGAAGRAGRGRFGGGLAVFAAATEPERAGQRDRAGHHPHGPRDGRAKREQQRGRKGHGGCVATMLPTARHAGGNRSPFSRNRMGRGAAKVEPGRLRASPSPSNRW